MRRPQRGRVQHLSRSVVSYLAEVEVPFVTSQKCFSKSGGNKAADGLFVISRKSTDQKHEPEPRKKKQKKKTPDLDLTRWILINNSCRKPLIVWTQSCSAPDGNGREEHHGGDVVQEGGEDGGDEAEDDDHGPDSSSGQLVGLQGWTGQRDVSHRGISTNREQPWQWRHASVHQQTLCDVHIIVQKKKKTFEFGESASCSAAHLKFMSSAGRLCSAARRASLYVKDKRPSSGLKPAAAEQALDQWEGDLTLKMKVSSSHRR